MNRKNRSDLLFWKSLRSWNMSMARQGRRTMPKEFVQRCVDAAKKAHLKILEILRVPEPAGDEVMTRGEMLQTVKDTREYIVGLHKWKTMWKSLAIIQTVAIVFLILSII